MKKVIFLFFLALLSAEFYSQTIDLKWSDQFAFDNKADGFFDDFVGSNSTYIYGKFSNLALSPRKQNRKIKLVAFDKVTMKKAGEAELRGYGKSSDKEDYDYYKTVTLNKSIYIFWTKKAKGITELYVQSFDSKLKKINGIKKIYELKSNKKEGYEKLVILYNKDLEDKMVIIKEFPVTKDNENLRVEYKLLNPDFSFISSKQITLPILITKVRRGFFSSSPAESIDNIIASYEFGNDGNLYIQETVKVSEEERKALKKGEASVYPHLMQVDMETGNIQEYRVKFPGKNTFQFSSLISKNSIKLYGFFSDLDKDAKGYDTHGTFFITLDNKTLKEKNSKFSYFDKTFLDQLYAADKENQKKGKGLFKSKKDKASDDESIDDNYVIEKVVEDGEDILLFCSIMRNWSNTVCTTSSNGGTTCRTYYYCTKSNVTSFRLNGKGDILWAKNLDRSITYNRWTVYDLNVMRKDNNYYVTYGSAFQMNAEKKNRRSTKSNKQLTDRLEYAVFNGQTGDFKKNEYQINTINAKKADKKFVKADGIQVFDNKMYTSCVKTKLKPLTYISCLCPPVFYFLYLNGISRKGTGYFGTIAPLK
ncbi:MAG: hypothetical protein H0W61_05720 [Bacteroidetes bacterium]|nr:hypothetical protein [Bacteroidota bacterium]